MTIEPKAIEQEFHYQVDQQVSVNSFIDIEVEGETVRFQVTSRYGSSPEKIVKTARANIEAYILLRQEFPRNFLPIPPNIAKLTPPDVVRQPIDDNGNNLPTVESFVVDKLIVSMHNGKFYFKVIGGRFTQYGVAAWDEVLKAAGIKIDMNDLKNLPNIAGWTAEYIMKVRDGKTVPDKVTRLLAPKRAESKGQYIDPSGTLFVPQ